MSTFKRVAWAGALLVGMFGLQSIAGAKVVYVTPTGDDTKSGLSWETAKGTVTGGLAAAATGDQVWVAAGTYVGCITLKAGVALYGGFSGTETELTHRDWVTHATILDGNATGTVVTAPSGATATTRIDGFTIRNGSLSNDGGGIYCTRSTPTITNNTITGNVATSSGGGIYCIASSSPVIANNTITGNVASDLAGGGIYCFSSSPTITGNLIVGNSAGFAGGGVYCYDSSPVIANNTIASNSAVRSGGGLSCSHGLPTITGNTITENSASSGGGIYLYFCSSDISNNIVAFNSSGLFKSYGGTPVLRNNCVYNPNTTNYVGLTSGVGDISVDPQLVAVGYGQAHLKAGSPCIDAGLDSAVQVGWTDIDGEVRTQGVHVDIGADEFNGTAPPFTPNVIRVRPDGSDANDGSSWAWAKRTVQAGINAASIAGGEVWVAAGTYNERITLKSRTFVYGGFGGTENSRSDRDWEASVTILQGLAAGSVVTASSIVGHGTSAVDGFTICYGTGTPVDPNISTYGGGIYCSRSSPVITNNTIAYNHATWLGGGIYCYSCSPTIRNNVIEENDATRAGGGIACSDYSSPAIVNNAIKDNSSTWLGGGIYCLNYSSPLIVGNMITSNRAPSGGGGITCDDNCSAAIANNTIAGNGDRGNGAAIECLNSPATIANNIVAFNSSGLYMIAYAAPAPTLLNNCVYNTSANYTNLSPGTGDVSLDPLFVNRTSGDYRLAPHSPCIDSGNNNAVLPFLPTDLDGRSRFFDDPTTIDTGVGTPPIVDMGAYEYHAPARADFNLDGRVDRADLIAFTACFSGPTIPYDPACGAAADLDGDTDVDQVDFGLFQRCFSGSEWADASCMRP